MLISIVVPVYNGSGFLRQAILSAVKQSYQDIEIIILDDASSDNSFDIAQSFIADHRVRVHRNAQNIGVVLTLNRLFEMATGDYVRILCQDDILNANDIQVTVDFLDYHPGLGCCFCDFEEIDEKGRKILRLPEHLQGREHYPTVISSSKALELLYQYGCLPGNLTAVTIWREAFVKVGGFNTHFKFAFDFDLWTRIAQSYPLGYIKSKLCQVRIHGSRLSFALGNIPLFTEQNVLFDQISSILKYKNKRELYILRKTHYQHQFHAMIMSVFRFRFRDARIMLALIVGRKIMLDIILSYPRYLAKSAAPRLLASYRRRF